MKQQDNENNHKNAHCGVGGRGGGGREEDPKKWVLRIENKFFVKGSKGLENDKMYIRYRKEAYLYFRQ